MLPTFALVFYLKEDQEFGCKRMGDDGGSTKNIFFPEGTRMISVNESMMLTKVIKGVEWCVEFDIDVVKDMIDADTYRIRQYLIHPQTGTLMAVTENDYGQVSMIEARYIEIVPDEAFGDHEHDENCEHHPINRRKLKDTDYS